MTSSGTEKRTLDIRVNGRKITLHTLTSKIENPLILYLHGGPGYGNSSHICEIFNSLSSTLLDEYSFAFYDQRCAGDSLSMKDLIFRFNVENHISDAAQVLKFTLKHFAKDKLILCSHSWGTHLGIKLAERFPNLVQGYIGIGQVVNGLRGEKLAYSYAARYENKKGLNTLSKLGPPPHRKKELIKYLSLHRKVLFASGGLDRSTIKVKNDQNRLNSAKLAFVQRFKDTLAMYISVKNLWQQCLDVDFSTKTHFNFPMVFICGRYDHTTPTRLVINYFRSIRTPAKLYIIDKTAHRPHLERFEAFEKILIDENLFLTKFPQERT